MGLRVADDADAETQPRIGTRQAWVTRKVAEGRNFDLVGRRVRDATVVVVPVPQETIARWLGRERVNDLHDLSTLVQGAPGHVALLQIHAGREARRQVTVLDVVPGDVGGAELVPEEMLSEQLAATADGAATTPTNANR